MNKQRLWSSCSCGTPLSFSRQYQLQQGNVDKGGTIPQAECSKWSSSNWNFISGSVWTARLTYYIKYYMFIYSFKYTSNELCKWLLQSKVTLPILQREGFGIEPHKSAGTPKSRRADASCWSTWKNCLWPLLGFFLYKVLNGIRLKNSIWVFKKLFLFSHEMIARCI